MTIIFESWRCRENYSNWPTTLTYLSISFQFVFLTHDFGIYLRKLNKLKSLGLYGVGTPYVTRQPAVLEATLKAIPPSVTTLGTDCLEFPTYNPDFIFWKLIPQNVTTLCLSKCYHDKPISWKLLPNHISTVHLENFGKYLPTDTPPHISVYCWQGSFFEFHCNPYGKLIQGANPAILLCDHPAKGNK